MRPAASALLLAGALGCSLVGDARDRDPVRRPNIVLVSVDTLRADHLGCYGYERRTSPAMDGMAATGVRFARAVAQAQWTLPSMASIHTGLYPSEHGATRAETRIPDQATTLAEALRADGYRTLAVVSHAFVDGEHGFAQGFDVFDESHMPGHAGVSSKHLTRTALRRLRRSDAEPFFLWVHYFDPHYDYVHHPEFGFASDFSWLFGRRAGPIGVARLEARVRGAPRPGRARKDHPYLVYARAVYDEEIAHTDHWIGRLLAGIEAQRPLHPTVVIVGADHGEAFLEHGQLGHRTQVYDEVLHVPLIVSGAIEPELRGRVVERTVEMASVAKTVATLARLRTADFEGEDLLAVARGETPPRPSFSEGGDAWSPNGRKRVAIADGWKLIHNLDDDSRELYHLASDPGERLNLWDRSNGSARVARETLTAELEGFLRRAPLEPVGIRLDEAQRERLRLLGYGD